MTAPRRQTIIRAALLAIELPPVAYVAATGHAPVWARAWIGVFLALWIAGVTIHATRRIRRPA